MTITDSKGWQDWINITDTITLPKGQSSTSTMEIDKAVTDLQKNSQEAVTTMERVSAIVKEQTNSVRHNKDKYISIAQAMKESESDLKQLNISSEEMAKMKDEILSTLENLSAIAEENSVAIEEVTSSMEEQSASIDEISSASEDLSSLAQDLQSVIRKFKVYRPEVSRSLATLVINYELIVSKW